MICNKGSLAMAEGKFVSYLRVSTDKQGRSGLGLEAQRDAVSRYLNGGRWKLVAEYVEVEKLMADAAQHAADLRGIVDDIRRSGITTVRGIAEELHNRGIRAPRGDTWHPTAVARLLSRLSNATHTN